MKRLIKLIANDMGNLKLISIAEKGASLDTFYESVEIYPARNKYGHLKTIVTLPIFFINSIYHTFKLLGKYDIKAIVSTGPGLVVVPALIFRSLNKKVIFLETWSRFTSKSLTGSLMSKISSVFYVQNKTLLNVYKNAVYSGRL